uniref:Uncharacterized protein LOC105038809 n=1 Tax=Elaeis guineensis var. tenera TaxID=51953 RepID=A0A6I9QQ46_ELAGV|nr:uncharacterized protein LOC105038809 [Elaeis guineensis]
MRGEDEPSWVLYDLCSFLLSVLRSPTSPPWRCRRRRPGRGGDCALSRWDCLQSLRVRVGARDLCLGVPAATTASFNEVPDRILRMSGIAIKAMQALGFCWYPHEDVLIRTL